MCVCVCVCACVTAYVLVRESQISGCILKRYLNACCKCNSAASNVGTIYTYEIHDTVRCKLGRSLFRYVAV